ncbi:MAG: hypothetical protein VX739_14865, partial [Planctomycetota bacterium]|nr:hypothetical protein [Planctomycetota bacterium]
GPRSHLPNCQSCRWFQRGDYLLRVLLKTLKQCCFPVETEMADRSWGIFVLISLMRHVGP